MDFDSMFWGMSLACAVINSTISQPLTPMNCLYRPSCCSSRFHFSKRISAFSTLDKCFRLAAEGVTSHGQIWGWFRWAGCTSQQFSWAERYANVGRLWLELRTSIWANCFCFVFCLHSIFIHRYKVTVHLYTFIFELRKLSVLFIVYYILYLATNTT